MRFQRPVSVPARAIRTVPASADELRRAPDGERDWMGLGEASRFLGISEGTLRRWADEGRVSVFTTPGGHRRFSRHLLRSLLPADRVRRPKLAPPEAGRERIVRAYRPSRFRIHEQNWIDTLDDDERTAFRERGRELVSRLLEHLDADPGADAAAPLQAACRLAADHGRAVARVGASMTDAVELFLRFRHPFMRELAGLARRRGLDTREATALFMQAEAAMDRLLVATMTGHSLAHGERIDG